jgi:predicted PurR-regulated permease PerM
MNDEQTRPAGAQNFTILMLTLLISAVFVVLVRNFLLALFLAAVFASLAYPLYTKVLSRLHGRQGAAAAVTLLILILIVLLPSLGMLDLIAIQAYGLTQEAVPWLEQKLQNPDELSITIPDWIPFRGEIESSGPQIATKLGELAGKTGAYLVKGLSAATKGTASFFLNLFVMLYAMFYFLRSGPPLVEKMLSYPPLSPAIQKRLIEKGLSVTRATIKGTLVIGLLQGALGGISFAVVGIQGAAFWGAAMALASVVPSVGTALVWVPAVIYLLVTGQAWVGIGLCLWCALVVGSVDNLLRPILVGNDTQMPNILILISTFGGLALFGMAGLIIGPVIASLFVTMWDIYYETFRAPLVQEEEAREGDD